MLKVLANATIILPDDVINGHVVVENGRLAEIAVGSRRPRGCLDLEGDFLLPGLVDLHSDHLEKHFVPRPQVPWHGLPAALSHDAQMVSAGITTVFDSLALTGMKAGIDRGAALPLMVEGLKQAMMAGVLRADHLLHIRCEVTEPDILDRFAPFETDPLVRLVSLMDHSPGQGQFPSMDTWLARHRAATGLTEKQLHELKDRRLEGQARFADRHRTVLAESAAINHLTIASHDDSTPEHVLDARRLGALISEFPTTREAAETARARHARFDGRAEPGARRLARRKPVLSGVRDAGSARPSGVGLCSGRPPARGFSVDAPADRHGFAASGRRGFVGTRPRLRVERSRRDRGWPAS